MDELEALLARDYLFHGRKSIRRARFAFARLRQFFPDGFPVSRAYSACTRYVEFRITEGAALGTAKTELSILARALRIAHESGLIRAIPKIPIPTAVNPRQGFFEPHELAAVLPHLTFTVQEILRFAYVTGWRRGEVLGLTWPCVDFEAGVVRLEGVKTKTGHARIFPFSAHPDLGRILASRKRKQLGEYVFHHGGRPYTGSGVWEQLQKACRKAGIPRRSIHDMRRSAVRNLERAGIPRNVAKQLTGHLTDDVYNRYDIVSERDLEEGVRRLVEWERKMNPDGDL